MCGGLPEAVLDPQATEAEHILQRLAGDGLGPTRAHDLHRLDPATGSAGREIDELELSNAEPALEIADGHLLGRTVTRRLGAVRVGSSPQVGDYLPAPGVLVVVGVT